MFNKKKPNFTTEETQNNKRRETHVELEGPSAPEIEEEDQDEGCNCDDNDEG